MGKNKNWKRQAKRIVGECLQERNKMMFCEKCLNMHCISYDIDNIRKVEHSIKRNNMIADRYIKSIDKNVKYIGIDWARGYK